MKNYINVANNQKKYRVLQVLGGVGFGGAETFVMNQFRTLSDEYIFDYVIQVRFPIEESYEKEIRQLGGNLFFVDTFRSNPFIYFHRVKKIVKKNGPYNAIHIHVNEQCGVSALAAKLGGADNIICHAHSNVYEQNNKLIKKSMLFANILFVKLTKATIVACSSIASETYFGRNTKPNHIFKNPIDVSNFCIQDATLFREKYKISKDAKIIIHIGRFIDVKNHEFIIEIAKQIKDRKLNEVILLVGDGEKFKYINDIVLKQGLSDCFRFLGTRKDVNYLLGVSDVLILPSKYEGLPTVVLEAQATGITSVISNRISDECDLHLQLVKFLPIDIESINEWIDTIESIDNNSKEYNREVINKAFKDSGIDLLSVSEEINKMYKRIGKHEK